MNGKQKVCLWAGIVAFLLMGLFPPWYYTEGTWTQHDYSLLWRPPMEDVYAWDHDTQRVRPQRQVYQLDTRRLYVQWAMVVVVTAGLLCTFHRKQQAQPPVNSQQQ